MEISIYGIFLAVGMLVGFAVLIVEAKRNNEDQNLYLIMAMAALVTGTAGARLFYVAFSWPLYQDRLMSVFYLQNGGMAVYGAILGGMLGIALFAALRKVPFWQLADTASIAFLSGQIIARWGDFFNRESFGEYNTTALAMQLPLSAVRSNEVTSLMREHLETVDGIAYIQVHPVFLYESVWCLILLIVLLTWKRKKKFQGEICMRYLSGYGLGRFFIEWLRTDALLIPGTRIPAGQVISAGLFVIFGLAAHVRRSMVKKREALRRRRREAIYEEEERAEAEMDAAEQKELELAALGEETEAKDVLAEENAVSLGEEPGETAGPDLENGVSAAEGPVSVGPDDIQRQPEQMITTETPEGPASAEESAAEGEASGFEREAANPLSASDEKDSAAEGEVFGYEREVENALFAAEKGTTAAEGESFGFEREPERALTASEEKASAAEGEASGYEREVENALFAAEGESFGFEREPERALTASEEKASAAEEEVSGYEREVENALFAPEERDTAEKGEVSGFGKELENAFFVPEERTTAEKEETSGYERELENALFASKESETAGEVFGFERELESALYSLREGAAAEKEVSGPSKELGSFSPDEESIALRREIEELLADEAEKSVLNENMRGNAIKTVLDSDSKEDAAHHEENHTSGLGADS